MSMTVEECEAGTRTAKPTPPVSDSVFEQLRSLKGRVAIVTGAADGLGLAMAESLAEGGANVALVYHSNKAAEQRASDMSKKYNITAKAYSADVSDSSQVDKLVSTVVAEFGSLDVFLANAGMGTNQKVTDTSDESYRKAMSVNVDGVFYCARAAGRVFKRQGRGNLIITSSMSGHIVNVPVDQAVYNSTKAAVRHLGKSLAREWREFARVNIISPGFFDTKLGASSHVLNEAHRMSVMGRQGATKEMKGLVLFLASDASTYMTGSDIIIDGGYTLP